MTPLDFLNQHEAWLRSLCQNIYHRNPLIHSQASEDDLFSEAILLLDKILDKYEQAELEGKLISFVKNRVRGYLDNYIKTLLVQRKAELKAMIAQITGQDIKREYRDDG
jgi:hypothetical protein